MYGCVGFPSVLTCAWERCCWPEFPVCSEHRAVQKGSCMMSMLKVSDTGTHASLTAHAHLHDVLLL